MNPGIATYLSLLLVITTGCSSERIVTAEQVNKIVSSRVSVGSSKEEVAAFIESLKIDSLRVIHENFEDAERLRWSNFDEEKRNALGDSLKEFYDAAIRDIAPSSGTFEGVIRMRFDFGAEWKAVGLHNSRGHSLSMILRRNQTAQGGASARGGA